MGCPDGAIAFSLAASVFIEVAKVASLFGSLLIELGATMIRIK